VITGASGFPFVNFVAFMYTASRTLALEKKGSFRELLTTSAHMLLYFRYDMPAMRQYAVAATFEDMSGSFECSVLTPATVHAKLVASAMGGERFDGL